MTDYTTNLRLVLERFNASGWHDGVNNNFRVLDAVINSALGITDVSGVWENSTEYAAGAKVIDPTDDTVWRANDTHVSPAAGTSFVEDRAANPARWSLVDTGLSVRGQWITGTAYSLGDVAYDEDEYVVGICTEAHTATTNIRTDKATGKWDWLADLKPAVTAAANSASTASSAAGTATTKAAEAVSSANTAEDHKDAAAQSAIDASDAKDAAVGAASDADGFALAASNSASAASDYADNASNSATDAFGHAGSASNAATAAVTAKGEAEAAQDAAEDAVLSAEAAAQAVWLAAVPIGNLADFPIDDVPAGYLKCDGGTFDPDVYPDLYAYLGTDVLPDFTDRVKRMAGPLAGAVGTTQEDAFQSHWHQKKAFSRTSNLANTGTTNYYIDAATSLIGVDAVDSAGKSFVQDPITDGVNGAPRTANETRVKSYIVITCIKAANGFSDPALVDLEAIADGYTELYGGVIRHDIAQALSDAAKAQARANIDIPYRCRAWVSFNGNGTVAIRGSGNVSSVTDNGVGDYTVNFTTAMPDVNYCVVGSASANLDPAEGAGFSVGPRGLSTNLVGSVRVVAGVQNGFFDVYQVHVAIFC